MNFIQGEKFTDQLKDCQFLKKESLPYTLWFYRSNINKSIRESNYKAAYYVLFSSIWLLPPRLRSKYFPEQVIFKNLNPCF